MWRRILGWGSLALALLLVALVGLLVSPVGLRLVLDLVRQQGTDIQAQGIRGWLWDFTLQDVKYNQPGIKAQAEEARIRLGLSEIFSKTIHLRAALSGAQIDVDPSKITTGGEGTWQTHLDSLEVQDTTVRLNGTPLNVPDASLSLDGTRGRELSSVVQTQDGKLQARTTFDPLLSSFKVDFNGDARILRYYYPGIQGGTLKGTYNFTPDRLVGDVKISGGRVQVPEFDVVDVTGIQGTLHHDGDLITARLSGQGLGGPVVANASVDLKAEQWKVVADATPSLNTLKMGGLSGTGKLHIETSGWEKVRTQARYLGSVNYQDVEVPDASIQYELNEKLQSFVEASGKVTALEQTGQLKASLQNLGTFWTGDATLSGTDFQARATLQNQRVQLTGQAFRVNLEGTYHLDTQVLQATAQTNLASLQENLQGNVKLQASGTLDRLQLVLSDSELRTDITGPLSLNGQGTYQDGVLELGTPHLDLTYQPSGGTWNLKNLPLQGIGTVNGSGNLRGENLLGTVGITGLPAEAEDVRGELTLNTRTLQFQLNAPKLQASGTPENFEVKLENYTLMGGVRQTVGGTVQFRDYAPTGSLRIQSQYQDVVARLNGFKADLQGTLLGPLKGLPVSGTADLEQARLNLGGILANVEYQPLKATFSQQGQQLNVELVDGKLNARGTLPLDTVQKAFNLPVSGTLRVNLVDSRGTAQFLGRYLENNIQAQLKVSPQQVGGQVQVQSPDVQASLSGPIYPTAALKGTVTAFDVQSSINITGPMDALKFQASGRTPEFIQADVRVPSKAFQLAGNLTPDLTASGTVGGLKVRLLSLEDLLVEVNGQETVQYQNQPYTAQLSGTWSPEWAGQIKARLSGPRIQARASGPWKQLQVNAAFRQQDLTLQASAKVNVPALTYSGTVSALYQDLKASGNLQGKGADFKVRATLYSPEQGTAQIEASGLDQFRIRASNFVYQDIAASGNLAYQKGQITGTLRARFQDHRVNIQALGSTFTATLQSPYGQGNAQGKLDFSDYQVQLQTDYFTSQLKGNLQGLSGTLTTVPQRYTLLEDQAEVPAQTFTVLGDYQKNRFSLSQGNEEVLFVGGQLSGGLTLQYALRDAGAGQVRISPTLQRIQAEFSGLVSGQAQVYPDIKGNLNLPLSLVTRLLPEDQRQDITPGQFQVQVSGPYDRLEFSAHTTGLAYQGGSLVVQGVGFWTPDTYQASVDLQHPLARLKGQVTPQTQTFEGTVDARLVPDLPEGVSGTANVQGTLKNFDLQTLSGSGNLQAAYQTYTTSGSFSVEEGLQVRADLKGEALEKAYRLTGQVYPELDATLGFDQAQGRIQGAYDRLFLALQGKVFDQNVNLNLQTRETSLAAVSGTVNGGTVQADVDLLKGQGTVNIQNLDLQQTAGIEGQVNLNAVLNSYTSATGQVSGTVQQVQVSGNLSWQDEVLGASAVQATLPQGTVQASGTLYPQLNLKGTGTLQDPVQLPLTFEATGELQNPTLQVHTTLPDTYEGLQLNGTTADLEIRNLKDIQVKLQGAITGQVQATYQDTLTLNRADLTFDLPVQREEASGVLTGTLGWNGSFQGNAQFSGVALEQPLTLQLTGNGPLQLKGTWQGTAFTGTVQPDVFEGLNAQISVPSFDLSKYTGLKDPVLLGATATVQGPWNSLKVQASGQVTDTLTGQNVQFKVSQQEQTWLAQLTGALQGEATYAASGWQVRGSTSNLNVGLFVSQLKEGFLTGAFEATGQGTTLSTITGSGLKFTALDAQSNPILLQGSVNYQPPSAALDLQGQYAGAPVRIGGRYPEGIQVEVQNFKVAEGTLNLSGTVSGDFSNPSISATGSFAHPQGTAQLQVGGVLDALTVTTEARLNGDLQGTVSGNIRVRNLDLNTLVLDLNADVEGAGVLAKGTIQGSYPNLGGTLRLQKDRAYVTLTGNGDGTYLLSDSNVATGTVRFQASPLMVSGDVLVNAVPLLEGASGSTQVQVNFTGDLETLSARYAGTLSRIQYQGMGVQEANIQGTFEGPYLAPQIQLSTRFSGATYQNASLQNITVQNAELQVNSVGAYERPALKASGTLEGVNYGNESLQQVTFSGTSTGDFQSPTVQLDASFKGLQYQQSTLGTGTLQAAHQGNWTAPNVRLKANLQGVKHQEYQLSNLQLEGTYQGTWPKPDVNLAAEGRGLQYQDAFARQSVVTLNGTYQGSTEKIQGTLAGQVEGVQFKTDHLESAVLSGSIRGTLQDAVVHFEAQVQDLLFQDIALKQGQVVADASGNLQSPTMKLSADLSGAKYGQDSLQAAKITANSTGDWKAPTVLVKADLTSLSYQGDTLARATVTATSQGDWDSPTVHVDADLSGVNYQGNMLQSGDFVADLKGKWSEPELRLDGTFAGIKYQDYQLQSADFVADLKGKWSEPELRLDGTFAGIKYQDYQLQTVKIRAHHQGTWQSPAVEFEAQGSGFTGPETSLQEIKAMGSTQGALTAPDLKLNATLTGVKHQEGQAQQAQINGQLVGPWATAQITGTASYVGLVYQDVQTADGNLTVKGTVNNPEVTLHQGGKTTLVYQNNQGTFSGFTATGFDHTVSLTGTAGLKTGDLKVEATGPFSGQVETQYTQTRPIDFNGITLEKVLQSYNLQVQHNASYQGYQAKGRFEVLDRQWSGTGTVGGLPSWLSADPIAYRLAGQDLPTAFATLNSYGLQAQLKLDTTQATLEFANTPQIQAGGSLTYTFKDGTFQGSTQFQKDTISMQLQGNGPTLQANLKQSETTVQATARLNPLQVDVTLSDGTNTGTARYTEAGWTLNIPTFNVGSLDGPEYQGQFSLTGQGVGTRGTLNLTTQGLKLPFTLPVLNEPVQGDFTAKIELGDTITAVASYQGPLGTLNLNLSRGQAWTGSLKANLRTSRNPGTLVADLQLQNQGVQGRIDVNQFGYTYQELSGVISGQVVVQNSQFNGNLRTQLEGGTLNLEGEGSLADVIPALEALGIEPSEEGYLVTVSASAFPLEKLGLLPHASGRIYGTASLTSGSSTVNVRIPDLTLPGSTPAQLEIPGLNPGSTPEMDTPRTVLNTRLDGTFSGGDARFRGSIGDTTFVASSTDGVLLGSFDFRSTPVHALIGAFTDTLPGQALLTGTGRIDGNLSELEQLKLSVVAENIKVTSAGQTLVGKGQFSLEQGTLTIPGIQLNGAGSLLIQGRYAPDEVNLTADFRDATFTPLLALVPALKDYRPSLQGNLSVKAMGTYGQPTIQVQGSNLKGELAGIGMQLNQLGASVNRNQLTFQGDLGTSGTVNSTLKLQGKADLAGSTLQNAQVDANGTLNVTNFGTLEGASIRINQQGEAWKLLLTGTRGGQLQASGDLFPDLNVRILLDQVQPELPNYYIKDASVSGLLNLVEVGGLYRLGGNVDLERLQFTLSRPVSDDTEKEDNFEFESPLPTEYTTFPERREDQDRAALASWVFDDILIDAQNNIRIDENLARAEFGGQLVLSGNAYTPRLQGDILPKRGSVFLRENEFVLNTNTTSIRFNAADGAYPAIYLEGVGNVRDEGLNVRVIMTVTGTFEPDPENPRERVLKPTTTLREEREMLGQCADPVRNPNSILPRCLDEASLYSLVVFGTRDLRNLPTELTQSALRTTLQVFLVGEIERSIQEALGIDVFRIRNYTIGADQSFNAEFTVGTYLSREWYIQYQVDLLGNGNFQVQYNALDGRLSLTFSSPLNRLDFNTVNPEFSLAYNFDTQNSIELGIATEQNTQGERGFSVKLGYKLKF